ncbi:MAG: substrate-binding domain-containing protein [Hyphomicrobiaceae bacterium]
MSPGAANGLVSSLEPEIRHTTGIGVAGDFGAVGGMRDRIVSGERVDLNVVTQAIIADLDARGFLVSGTISDIGTVVTSVAVREGDIKPDIASGAELRSALLAADAIYFPDPERATAGIHIAKVVQDLGIHDSRSRF